MLNVIYSWIVILLLTTIFGTFGVVLSLIAPNSLSKHVFRPWARLILFFTRVKVEVSGYENIPKVPCVFMYNHQSIFDVFSFMSVLPVEWKAVMKKEVSRMPFIGWIAILSRHYLVSRDGSARDANEVRKIVRNIKNGPSVVLAPEGTRSPDGKLQDFQEGGFLIAMLARVPVVTMVMQGGLERRSNVSRGIVPGTMKVTIFPPIDVTELPKGKEGRQELIRIVKSQMEEVLTKKESDSTT
jgi:1-acyl-sn-glycerol-3-phosphate acyltransferase